MQTFLPTPDFRLSAMCLDYKRLGKQRLECHIILNTLKNGMGNWYNHPAVKMWKGSESYLADYGNAIIQEWIDRGYNNNMWWFDYFGPSVEPWWLGNENFHSGHRAALLFKDEEHYSQFGWPEEPELNYWWPTEHEVSVG
jgi:hypothetical protein